MMRLVVRFGIIAGGIIAAGRLSAAQWQQIGQLTLALTLVHGLTVLPWLLALLFATLWLRQRKRTDHWIDRSIDVQARQVAAPRKRARR